MISSSSRRLAACMLGGVGFMVVPHAARAQSIELSADAQTDLGYSNNPYNNAGGSSSIFAEARAQPTIRWLSVRDNASVQGDVRFRHFFKNGLPDDDSYGLSGAYSHQFSPYSQVSVNAAVRDARNTIAQFVSDIGDPSVPGVPGVPGTGEDLSLLGQRTRRYTLGASGSFTLSPRMSVSTSGGFNAARYSGSNLQSYDSYSTSASLSRSISEHASIGLGGAYVKSAYRDPLRFDSSVVSAFAQGTIKLNTTWTLDGRVGASFVSYKEPGIKSSTGATGSANLCRRGEYGTLCVSAGRDFVSTGSAGTVPQTHVGLSYGRKLGEFDSISGNVAYLTSENSGESEFGTKRISTNVNYGRGIGPRLKLAVGAFFNKLFGNQSGRPSDYGATIGLSYHFGELR